MTASLTAWLLMTTALGGAATLAAWSRTSRFRTAAVVAFLAAAGASYYATALPLGNPIEAQPPAGHYTVVGARIDMPSATSAGAIYVLLDNGNGAPVYYKLPFSSGDADDLQEALNAGVQGDGGVGLEAGDGEYVFHPAPVTGDEQKRADETL